MKKITQRAVFLLLLMGSLFCRSQESFDEKNAIYKAQLQLTTGSKYYNPQEAIATYNRLADNGNAKAMNGLGLIYSKGLSVPVNESEGVKWFEKAAKNGYAKAWYNLALLYKDGIGTIKDPVKAIDCFEKGAKAGYSLAWEQWAEMYKNGEGIPQNYVIAMDLFKQGADNGSIHSLYAQGYLYYKGFGCTQDYGKAIVLFESASKKGSKAAMYMLGLCYRNGYGTTIDADKAKFWLKKSATLGAKSAERELSEDEPENANPNQAKTVSKPVEEVITITEANVPETFKKVRQDLANATITGEYVGTLLRYDWSGQNIISTTSLEIELNQSGKEITGEWKEEAGDTAPFTANIEESAIVFQDSKIDRLEHFHKDAPITYDFKEAKLQLLKADASLFIVGNLQLYDSLRHENEKPMYLILEKKQESINSNSEIISSVVIYPNPIISEFNLSFNLAKAVDVKMEIFYLTGRPLFNENWKNLNAGYNIKTISLNVPTGYYVLRLTYDNQVKSTILIKQ